MPLTKIVHRSQRRTNLYLLLSGFLAIVGCAVFVHEVNTLLQRQHEQKQTEVIVRSLLNCLDDVQDMETGQRGFLLTGKESYLEPFNAGRSRIKVHLAELSQQIQTSAPRYASMPETLGQLAAAKENELLRTVMLRQEGRLNEALTLVNSDRGKRYMDDIRALISGHAELFRQHTADLNEATSRHIALAKAAFFFWIGAILALLGSAVWQLRQTQRVLHSTSSQLATQAMHDPLTGLPNRRYLQDWLKNAIARGARLNQTVAALYIDLDGFSEINNRFGHEAGDIALRHAGAVFKGNLRESDFLARLGGDEFVIISCGYTIAQLEQLGQRLLTILASTSPMESVEPGVLGASIGIALFPDHAKTVEELIRRADGAMYQAKMAGKCRYRVAQK